MNAKSILVFFRQSARAANDASNKLRETILTSIHDTVFTEDPVYGQQWRKVQSEWKRTIQESAKVPFDTFRVEHKGGRTNNHDFLVQYFTDVKVAERKLEFKVGKNMASIPQFLSLYVSFGMFPRLYDHYYYHEYLDKYLSLVGTQKPPYEEYQKELYKSKSFHPFFKNLYEKKDELKKEKDQIVNESIQTYLEKYSSELLTETLYQKLQVSQDKIFLLWNNEKFETHTLHFDPLVYTGFTKNQILLKSGDLELRLLLRWKNHKGILGPAWQISVKPLK